MSAGLNIERALCIGAGSIGVGGLTACAETAPLPTNLTQSQLNYSAGLEAARATHYAPAIQTAEALQNQLQATMTAIPLESRLVVHASSSCVQISKGDTFDRLKEQFFPEKNLVYQCTQPGKGCDSLRTNEQQNQIFAGKYLCGPKETGFQPGNPFGSGGSKPAANSYNGFNRR